MLSWGRSVQLFAREVDCQVERLKGLRNQPGLLRRCGKPGRPDDHRIPAGHCRAGWIKDPAHRHERDWLGCEAGALCRFGESNYRNALQAIPVGVVVARTLRGASAVNASSRVAATAIWAEQGSPRMGI